MSRSHLVMDHAIGEIVRGHSYRRDLDDLDELCDSIRERGLLTPPSVTESSVLIAGSRRLAAMERLGYRVTPVWVVHGVSDRLSQVLAMRDEQTLRRELKPVEQAELYEELKALYAEDAARRKEATQFGSLTRDEEGDDEGPGHGGADSAPPVTGNDHKARVQAAKAVSGRDSRTQMEQITELKRIAADDEEDPMVRQDAAEALIELNEDGKVNGRYVRVKAAQGVARLRGWAEHPDTAEDIRQAASAELAAVSKDLPPAERAKEAGLAVARVQKLIAAAGPERVGWADVDPLMRQKHAVRKLVDLLRREHGWWERFDPAEIGQYATTEQWELIDTYLTGTAAFGEAAREARTADVSEPEAPVEAPQSDEEPPGTSLESDPVDGSRADGDPDTVETDEAEDDAVGEPAAERENGDDADVDE